MTIRFAGALLCALGFSCVGYGNVAAQGGVFVGGVFVGGGGGFHITENESPRPYDRKANKAGSRNGQSFIFDRWGRTDGGGKRTKGGFSSVGDPHETTGDGRVKSRMSANEASASGALKTRTQKLRTKKVR